MKKNLLKGSIFALVMTLMFSAMVFASSGKQIDKKVKNFNVSLVFNNDDVKTGDNDFSIVLKDSNNQPVTNAQVVANVDMDKNSDMGMNMDDSETKQLTLKEGSEKGTYSGTANFTDKGKWIITTYFTVNGEESNVSFDVDVQSGGPNWLVIGGFLGAIVLIIIVAAVMKNKRK